MNDGIIISIIAAATAILVAFINAKFSSLTKKVNGRMDELLDLTRKSSKAEGKAEQKQEDKK